MDPAQKLIRWTIPAAVLFLTITVWELTIALFFVAEPGGVRLLEGLDVSVTLFVVVLGVPIGFLMNQIYFYLWDSAGPWMRGMPVPFDRGLSVLEHLKDGQLRYLEERTGLKLNDAHRATERPGSWISLLGMQQLKPTDNTVRGRQQYSKVRRQNWRAVRWLMTHALKPEDSAALQREYASRMDTYHAVGGSRYAVVTGTAVVLVYNVAVHSNDIEWHGAELRRLVLAVTAIVVMTILVMFVLTRARRNTLRVTQEVLQDTLLSCLPEVASDGGRPIDRGDLRPDVFDE